MIRFDLGRNHGLILLPLLAVTIPACDNGLPQEPPASHPWIEIGEGTGTMWVKTGRGLGGTASVRYPDGSKVVITSGDWRTEDPAIARVTSYPGGPAVLVPVTPGTTHLFVDYMGISGNRPVTVYSWPLADPYIEIGIGSDPITFNVGDSVSGSAKAHFPDWSHYVPGDRWYIGDPTVATISLSWPDYVVELTGVARGTTSVLVDSDGLVETRAVQVLDPSTPRTGRAVAGRWTGQGTNPDGSTYSVCFFVAPDRKTLTSLHSTCDRSASFLITLDGLTNSRGAPCNVHSRWQLDAEISFETAFRVDWSSLTEGFSGEFSGSASASGMAFTNNFTAVCKGSWSASPG
ncbi:MAG: hypothetical protein JSW51_02030 [Gemmatimonadota bacterium]|nr:MAG: hypothetical protein JSW51_02030 [Gemmatimonadota bacterium]